jgi:hypothetical protein
VEENPCPRGAASALSSCPSPSSVRQEQTELLDHKKLSQRDQAGLPGVGIPFRAFVLVYQRDHMPRQDSGNVAKEDDSVPEVRDLPVRPFHRLNHEEWDTDFHR